MLGAFSLSQYETDRLAKLLPRRWKYRQSNWIHGDRPVVVRICPSAAFPMPVYYEYSSCFIAGSTVLVILVEGIATLATVMDDLTFVLSLPLIVRMRPLDPADCMRNPQMYSEQALTEGHLSLERNGDDLRM
jgi:hypothetical protein